MIDAKVKEALQHAMQLMEVFGNGHTEVIVAEAYLEAEWQRRKAEFELEHVICSQPGYFHCKDGSDPRHNFTDADWRAEVEGELKG